MGAETVTMLTPEGTETDVKIDEVGKYAALGYVPESGAERIDRLRKQAVEERHAGLGSGVLAGALGAARGATFGLSDVGLSLLGTEGSTAEIRELQEARPGASGLGELGGALASSLLTGGAGTAGRIARATPSGALSRATLGLTERIAGEGAESAGRYIAGTAAGGALEGAAQSTGAYLSDVALGRRELSAEGLVGSMSGGALFGGALGGAFAGVERGTIAARKLFPRSHAGSRDAFTAAQQSFDAHVDDVMRSADDLERTARQRLDTNRIRTKELEAERIRLRGQPEARQRVADIDLERAKLAAQRTDLRAEIKAERTAAKTPAEVVPAPPAATASALAPTPEIDDAVTLGQKADTVLSSKVDEFVAAKERVRQVAKRPSPTTITDDGELERLLGETKRQLDETGESGRLRVGVADTAEDATARLAAPAAEASEIDDFFAKLKANAPVPEWKRSTRKVVPSGPAEETALGRALAATEKRISGGEGLREVAAPHILGREVLDAMDDAIGRMPKGHILDVGGQQITQRQARAWVEKMRRIGGAGTLSAAPRRGIPTTSGRFVDEAQEGIEAIGNFERAQAELVRELGDAPEIPPVAKAMADQYWQSATDQERKTVEKMAMAADQVSSGTLAATPAARREPGAIGKTMGKATELAALVEGLQTLGVPGLPDVDSLPLVGPLLGMFLKFKAGMAAYKRLGGRIPASIEAKAAAKSAGLRDRAADAVDRVLSVTGAAARVGRRPAVTAATVLASPLWPGSQREEGKTAAANARNRIDELAEAAADPDAVRAAVRAAVPSSDPDFVRAVEDAVLRKLSYLQRHAPSPPAPSVLGRRQWSPSRSEIASFARRIQAAEDPVSVLEDLADGTVSREAAETLREVYPEIFAEVQTRLIERATELEESVPYKRRLQISSLFDVPLDDSLKPENLHHYQELLSALNRSSQPQTVTVSAPAQGSGPVQPTPSVANKPDLAAMTMTPEQKRSTR